MKKYIERIKIWLNDVFEIFGSFDIQFEKVLDPNEQEMVKNSIVRSGEDQEDSEFDIKWNNKGDRLSGVEALDYISQDRFYLILEEIQEIAPMKNVSFNVVVSVLWFCKWVESGGKIWYHMFIDFKYQIRSKEPKIRTLFQDDGLESLIDLFESKTLLLYPVERIDPDMLANILRKVNDLLPIESVTVGITF